MKNIKFPSNKPFTAKEIHSRYVNVYKNSKTKKAITYTGLFLKIQKQISLGNIEAVGTKPSKGRGRPQVIYRWITQVNDEKGISPEAAREIHAPEATSKIETPSIVEIAPESQASPESVQNTEEVAA